MAKFYVPILAIRHAYVSVDAESEHDALAKGWDTVNANQCQWLYETCSVEKPFLQLTEEEGGGGDFPEALGSLPLSAVKPLTHDVSSLLQAIQ